MKRHGTATIWVGLWLGLMVTLGCNEQAKVRPDSAPADPLPKLADLQPVTAPSLPGKVVSLADLPYRVHVRKLIYPADDARVDLALGALERLAMPGDGQAVWQANGLHAARLPTERLALFSSNLPAATHTRRLTILPQRDASSVSMVQKLDGAQEVRVSEEPGRPQIERFFGGEYRLMVQLHRPIAQGQPPLELWPMHQHGRRVLFDRGEDRQESLGRSFDALRMVQAPPIEEAWLIWSDLRAENPDEVPKLGPAMMTGQVGDSMVRLVMIVTVEPMHRVTTESVEPDEPSEGADE